MPFLRSFRVALVVSIGAVNVFAASPALADTASFTSPGCTAWPVPAGVGSVDITATGSAGQTLQAGIVTLNGGTGDVVSGTLTGFPAGQVLDVCVNSGGGGAGTGGGGGANGGAGGGASGVSLGSDFSTPVLIAAGGGGAAAQGQDGGAAALTSGGTGSSAPNNGGQGGTGGDNATPAPGMGGAGGQFCLNGCQPGGNGAPLSSAGPGTGGKGGNSSVVGFPTHAGGGGGAGYYGGGGGGGGTSGGAVQGGGGGGGTDFCSPGLTAPLSLSGCGVTGQNSTFGTASVTLTYTAPPPNPPPPAGNNVEDPKCKKLRKKLKRQKHNLASNTGKRTLIQANVKDTGKRLQKLRCK